MSNHFIFNKIKILKVLKYPALFVLSAVLFISWNANLYASDADWPISLFQAKELTDFQKEARLHRAQGLEQQNIGNIQEAMTFYQKAIEIDPAYAVPYNDLGIIYEAMGEPVRAEEYYQKALTIDPNYLSSYSNLALLYESQGDTRKALIYWKQRAELGSPNDPWTQKAKARLVAFKKAYAGKKQVVVEKEREREKEIEALNREVARQKKLKKERELKEIRNHLISAKKFYNQGKYKEALKELKLVLAINPKQKSALAIKEKIRLKVIEQKKRMEEEKKKRNINKMQEHFESGIKYYQQDNPQAATAEFSKIGTLITSPQKKH